MSKNNQNIPFASERTWVQGRKIPRGKNGYISNEKGEAPDWLFLNISSIIRHCGLSFLGKMPTDFTFPFLERKKISRKSSWDPATVLDNRWDSRVTACRKKSVQETNLVCKKGRWCFLKPWGHEDRRASASNLLQPPASPKAAKPLWHYLLPSAWSTHPSCPTSQVLPLEPRSDFPSWTGVSPPTSACAETSHCVPCSLRAGPLHCDPPLWCQGHAQSG